MNLVLERQPSFDGTTIGELVEIVNDRREHRCWICEDEIRERPNVPVEVWKVATKTAIPAGRYLVVITESARFHRPLPLLVDVPGFTGIRIHPGNSAADTDGCLLPGLSTDGRRVYHSRQAFDDLYQRMAAAMADGQTVFLLVQNPSGAREA